MNKNANIPPATIINRENYFFLYNLLKSIFIYDSNSENVKRISKKLELFSKKIKDKYNILLKREYSRENFENIIKYVTIQNRQYGGEILESIIITIFTSIMTIPPKETINKYIYHNLGYVYDLKNKEEEKQKEEIDYIRSFIIYDKLYPEELRNKEIFFQSYKMIPTILEYFICSIYKLKLDSAKYFNIKGQNAYNKISYSLYKNALKNLKNNEEKKILENSLIDLSNKINQIFENYNKNDMSKNKISIISFFFFTLFTNYQIINSRLINFNTMNNDKYADVEYDYNLSGSLMKGHNAMLVCSSMRQDNRIKKISLRENNLGELGMFELGKTIIFNPHIRILNYNNNKLYNYYFHYLNKSTEIFNNNMIEEINLQCNNLTNDIDDYLCDILKKFTNLKSINLSKNNINSGMAKFFHCLKLLYRQKKSKLEKIYLNSCKLDKLALYELAECLKSKYCKLKCLYLNINNINDSRAELLMNSIKKNKSLEKIYLGRNIIGNSSTEKICKMISRFSKSIEIIYLNNNEIQNNDNLLRIISRTKIIYSLNEDKNKNINRNIFVINLNKNNILKSLDISKNNIYIRNKNQLLLIKSLIKDTYLSCLDYSLILKDIEHHEIFETKYYKDYNKELNSFIDSINLIKNERNKLLEYINEIKIFYNKKKAIFEKYTDNKKLINILTQIINDNNIIMPYEDVENFLSNELLDIFGKTEEELYNYDNYYLIINIIKYMLLYKINGGCINNWLQGINKCLVII